MSPSEFEDGSSSGRRPSKARATPKIATVVVLKTKPETLSGGVVAHRKIISDFSGPFEVSKKGSVPAEVVNYLYSYVESLGRDEWRDEESRQLQVNLPTRSIRPQLMLPLILNQKELPAVLKLSMLAVVERRILHDFYATKSGLGGKVLLKEGAFEVVEVEGYGRPECVIHYETSDSQHSVNVASVRAVEFMEGDDDDLRGMNEIYRSCLLSAAGVCNEIAKFVENHAMVEHRGGLANSRRFDPMLEIRQRLLKKARGICDDVDKLGGGGWKAMYLKGRAEMFLGRFSKALECCKTGKERGGLDERARFERFEREIHRKGEQKRRSDRKLAKGIGTMVSKVMNMNLEGGKGEGGEGGEEG